MSSDAYALYLRLVDDLRRRRSEDGWRAEQDRVSLEVLEDQFEKLSPDEQRQANEEGWQSWPDLSERKSQMETMEKKPTMQIIPIEVVGRGIRVGIRAVVIDPLEPSSRENDTTRRGIVLLGNDLDECELAAREVLAAIDKLRREPDAVIGTVGEFGSGRE